MAFQISCHHELQSTSWKTHSRRNYPVKLHHRCLDSAVAGKQDQRFSPRHQAQLDNAQSSSEAKEESEPRASAARDDDVRFAPHLP